MKYPLTTAAILLVFAACAFAQNPTAPSGPPSKAAPVVAVCPMPMAPTKVTPTPQSDVCNACHLPVGLCTHCGNGHAACACPVYGGHHRQPGCGTCVTPALVACEPVVVHCRVVVRERRCRLFSGRLLGCLFGRCR